MNTKGQISIELRDCQIQKIDVLKIPKDFVFNKSDLIFEHLDIGYFIELPNKNLEPFVYGEVYNYKKLLK